MRIYCPLFDDDLHKRKQHESLCSAHKTEKKTCIKCQQDRAKAFIALPENESKNEREREQAAAFAALTAYRQGCQQ